MSLTKDAREEITQQVNRVLDDVNSIPAGAARSMGIHVDEYLLPTAHYFTSLAAQLLASGLDESTGVGDVAHRIEEEAQRLRRLAGGSYGSSGNSSGA